MAIARFWRETQSRYNLYGRKCGNCGQVFFPPRELCPVCRRASMGKMEKILPRPNRTLIRIAHLLGANEDSPLFAEMCLIDFAATKVPAQAKATG